MESNQNYSSPFYRLFAESSVAMVIMDPHGEILETNLRFDQLIKSLEISGAKYDEKGKLTSMRAFLDLQEDSQFNTFFYQPLRGLPGELVFDTPVHSNSSNPEILRWFKVHAWLIEKNEDAEAGTEGPFIGCIVADQTLTKEKAQQLLSDRNIAEKATEAKGQFLANMSHEIRTPIQTIIGMVELLQDTKLNKEQSEYSGQVKFSAEVLLSLINDILDYSKIEAGKMELECTDFDLEKTIKQSVEMISLEARRKGLALILDIPSDANIIVRGDPNKFRQVLINLVKNAVKFTKEGSVTITARIKDRKQISVAVADTGIGISEENRIRLFNSFMQADASTTRRYGGTGLGLAISRNLVELMNGSIEMNPNKGGGSVFSFTIPLETAFAVSAPEPEILPPSEGKNPEEAAVNKKKVFTPDTVSSSSELKPLILIVEDSPINQKLFAMMVDKLGYPSILADDGFGALEKAADNPVDLVLMDIQMPRMNGYEATETLRKRGFEKPVIAITASALSGERERCMEVGFNDILIKPFTRPEIAAILDKWISISPENNPSAAEKKVPAFTVKTPADVPEELVPDNEIFDKEYLLNSFMNDEETAKSLLAQYLERTESQIESLPSLIEKEDWESSRREAHTIKGSALTVGGRELGKAAGILESACMNGDKSSAMAALSPSATAFKRFKTAIEKYLDEE